MYRAAYVSTSIPAAAAFALSRASASEEMERLRTMPSNYSKGTMAKHGNTTLFRVGSSTGVDDNFKAASFGAIPSRSRFDPHRDKIKDDSCHHGDG